MKVKQWINSLEKHNLEAEVRLILNNQEIDLTRFCICSNKDCKCQEKEIVLSINTNFNAKRLYFVELDGKDEYCNEAYVSAYDSLEAEKKLIEYSSGWDEGRPIPRKAISIKYLAEENFGTGVTVPIFIK